MRVAVRVLSALVVGIVSAGVTHAMAEVASALPPPVSSPISAAPVAVAPALPPAVLESPSSAFKAGSVSTSPALPPASSAGIVMPTPSMQIASLSEGGSSSSTKLPDSMKNTIKNLNNTGAENVTLDDLNSAREVVAKLDILIDIEKRLSDLAQIRRERDNKSMNMGSVMPMAASSLLPSKAVTIKPAAIVPIEPTPYIVNTHAASSSSVSVGKNVTIIMIAGGAGNFSAKVKVGESSPQLVRIGDKLSDGSLVKAISSSGVTLAEGKNTVVVPVKNVSIVASGSRTY